MKPQELKGWCSILYVTILYLLVSVFYQLLSPFDSSTGVNPASMILTLFGIALLFFALLRMYRLRKQFQTSSKVLIKNAKFLSLLLISLACSGILVLVSN